MRGSTVVTKIIIAGLPQLYFDCDAFYYFAIIF